MKNLSQSLPALMTVILTASLFPRFALAQDAGTEATQQAIQASQQATQQAIQDNQQASQAAAQQAMQQAMQAAQDDNYSTSYPQQQAAPPPIGPTGPIPAQIATAHTIFFANRGADPNFPVDPAMVFNDLAGKLQAWGYYRLVDSPEQADLMFQLRALSPITDVGGYRGGVYSVHSPTFELTIRDPKTRVPLWTVTSPAYFHGRKQVFAHWLDLSEDNVISRLKVLAGQSLSPQESAELETYPKTHFGRNEAIITAVVIGAGVAGGVILHHEFEKSISNQKSQQDAFCNANQIPLSECAGG